VSNPARDWLFPPDLGAQAVWTASSTTPGFAKSGRGTSTSTLPFFVHSAHEEQPFVKIDLPRTARIREIRILNRTDCCAEQEVPLNVEVPDGAGWRLLCQRRTSFWSWTCHPPPTLTKTLRVVLPSGGVLLLKGVSVYE
jgi:hypothetical protein